MGTINIDTNLVPDHDWYQPDTSPVLGHFLVHSINKAHALVITVELIWLLFLNTISLNFFQTNLLGSENLKIAIYIARLLLQPTNVNVALLFLLDVPCSDWSHSFFCSCLSPIMCSGHLRNQFLLSTPVAPMWSSQRWVRRQRNSYP